MRITNIVLGLLIISSAVEATETITFRDVGEHTYVVVLTASRDIGEQEGLRLIRSAASRKCDQKPAQLGQYRFKAEQGLTTDGNAANDSFLMEQQLYCGVVDTVEQEPTKPLTDQQKQQLEFQAKGSSELYLDRLAASEMTDAYSMLGTALKGSKTLDEWSQAKTLANSELGELLDNKIWRISTYVDPASAPVKGVYIAVDFERVYENSPLYCGYLVWFLEGDALKMIRDNIGSINQSQFDTLKSGGMQDLTELKAQFGCNRPKE